MGGGKGNDLGLNPVNVVTAILVEHIAGLDRPSIGGPIVGDCAVFVVHGWRSSADESSASEVTGRAVSRANLVSSLDRTAE